LAGGEVCYCQLPCILVAAEAAAPVQAAPAAAADDEKLEKEEEKSEEKSSEEESSEEESSSEEEGREQKPDTEAEKKGTEEAVVRISHMYACFRVFVKRQILSCVSKKAALYAMRMIIDS